MQLEDSFSVPSPIEKVWAIMSNPLILAELFPGVEFVERLDEARTRARLRVKIGYISATFEVEGEIVETDFPRLVRSRVSGKDKRLGSMVVGETSLSFATGAHEFETLVRYAGNVRVTGQIATFGRPFIESKAKKELQKFIDNVRTRLAKEAEFARP